MRAFVLDTVAVIAILFEPSKLTRMGRAIVDLAEDFGAELVVPSFALVEMTHWTRRRKGPPVTAEQILQTLLKAEYVRIEPLGVEQVWRLPELDSIPDLHDRIIAVHALTNDAPLMTPDHSIRDSGLVETVW